ncbi:hypothetical protein EMIT051CA3_40553 [Pseudomonas chlororaphis]
MPEFPYQLNHMKLFLIALAYKRLIRNIFK